jgi:hypothetical protein
VSYDLLGHVLTIALVIYFGLHLRQKLQTLQATVAAQEKTIAAQAEQIKAQSTVLQDAERLSKMMQQVIDFVNPEAQLKREQAFQARLERETDHRLQEMAGEVVRTNSLLAVITEAMGEMRQKLAEMNRVLSGINRAGRERVEALERQLALEPESPQDL